MDHDTGCAVNGPCKGFNFCLVAKSIVAIAAIPLIAAIAASLFTDSTWQFAAAAYSGALVILIAQRIDRLAMFAPLIVHRKTTHSRKSE